MNKRPLVCVLGIHRTDKTHIYAKRVTGSYFRTFCRCKKCGELVEEGSLEMPLPQYMSNIELEMLEESAPNIPWIFADLDTIIDCYSEAEEGET